MLRRRLNRDALDLASVSPGGATLKLGHHRVYLDEDALKKLYFITNVALVEMEEVYHVDDAVADQVPAPGGEFARTTPARAP